MKDLNKLLADVDKQEGNKDTITLLDIMLLVDHTGNILIDKLMSCSSEIMKLTQEQADTLESCHNDLRISYKKIRSVIASMKKVTT